VIYLSSSIKPRQVQIAWRMATSILLLALVFSQMAHVYGAMTK